MSGSAAAALAAGLATSPLAAHIPERCCGLLKERIDANTTAIEAFVALSDLVYDDAPKRMIDRATADASGLLLTASALAEFFLMDCIDAE